MGCALGLHDFGYYDKPKWVRALSTFDNYYAGIWSPFSLHPSWQQGKENKPTVHGSTLVVFRKGGGSAGPVEDLGRFSAAGKVGKGTNVTKVQSSVFLDPPLRRHSLNEPRLRLSNQTGWYAWYRSSFEVLQRDARPQSLGDNTLSRLSS